MTGAFIGDLALDYAIHYSRYGGEDLWDGRTKTEPRYELDMNTFRHRCSVAIPEPGVSFMPIEYQATSFVSDGYPNLKSIKDSGSSSMKNWMQKQCIAPFAEFSFSVVSKEFKLPSKMTIRVGNGRETLIELLERPLVERVTLNAFTIEKLLKKTLPTGSAIQVENARYILIHGIPISLMEESLGWYQGNSI